MTLLGTKALWWTEVPLQILKKLMSTKLHGCHSTQLWIKHVTCPRGREIQLLWGFESYWRGSRKKKYTIYLTSENLIKKHYLCEHLPPIPPRALGRTWAIENEREKVFGSVQVGEEVGKFPRSGGPGRELSGRGTEGNPQAQGTMVGNKHCNQLH